jgi:hypothetical protein
MIKTSNYDMFYNIKIDDIAIFINKNIGLECVYDEHKKKIAECHGNVGLDFNGYIYYSNIVDKNIGRVYNSIDILTGKHDSWIFSLDKLASKNNMIYLNRVLSTNTYNIGKYIYLISKYMINEIDTRLYKTTIVNSDDLVNRLIAQKSVYISQLLMNCYKSRAPRDIVVRYTNII